MHKSFIVYEKLKKNIDLKFSVLCIKRLDTKLLKKEKLYIKIFEHFKT